MDAGRGVGEQVSASMGGNIQNAPSPPHLEDHPGLLQQVSPHVGPDDVVPLVKANLNILPKAAAVVIAGGFGISDGLFRTNKRCARGGGLAQCLGIAAEGHARFTSPGCIRE